jgi:hypothetical protein
MLPLVLVLLRQLPSPPPRSWGSLLPLKLTDSEEEHKDLNLVSTKEASARGALAELDKKKGERETKSDGWK